MPTYEYRCGHCGHQFEEFQSMSAEPFEICPSCGHAALKRVFGGGAGMIFKGSGFYLTDYRKAGPTESTNTKQSSATTPSAGETKQTKTPTPPKEGSGGT